MTHQGIDFAEPYQQLIDAHAMKQAKFDFAIRKVSESDSTASQPNANADLNALHLAGIAEAIYAFVHPSVDGVTQANVAMTVGRPGLPVICDCEVTDNQNWNTVATVMHDFLDTVISTGRAVMIYDNVSWTDILNLEAWKDNLFLANPGVGAPQRQCSMWQKGVGPVPGINGDADLDQWELDDAAFDAFFGLVSPHVQSYPGLNAPISAMACTPTGKGYWLVGEDGGVFTFGDAQYHGSLGGKTLVAPIVAVLSSVSGAGYWLVGADGGVFSFGDAVFYGSMGGKKLNAPIVGAARTQSGKGYWLAAADGGVFTFGDATFDGSEGGKPLNKPIVSISTASESGYWLFAADGGVFSFGKAAFDGSTGGQKLNAPIVGAQSTPDGKGYWLVAADGGVFSFGDAVFDGSMGGKTLNAPVVGMATCPTGGYWLCGADGGIFSFKAPFYGAVAK